MSDKTLFFVQPYAIRRRKLVPSGALTFFKAEEAIEAGAGLARRRAGIVVLAQTYDPVKQVMNRPRVLHIHGQVPTEWTDSRQAA